MLLLLLPEQAEMPHESKVKIQPDKMLHGMIPIAMVMNKRDGLLNSSAYATVELTTNS